MQVAKPDAGGSEVRQQGGDAGALALRVIGVDEFAAVPGEAQPMPGERRRNGIELGLEVKIVGSESAVGGGSLPGERLPTTVLVIAPRRAGAAGLLRRLREQEPPVIGRIQDERVLLDPRTVLPDEDDVLIEAVRRAVT